MAGRQRRPPVGTALGPAGINIGEFVKQFNDATKDMEGVVPAEINVYEDRTFSFILKTPPASSLILKAIGVEKGGRQTASSKGGHYNPQTIGRNSPNKNG